jgi:hypothetical protein
MSDGTTLLKELLRQRHLKYETFRAEYERTAVRIAADGVAPSKAQYYRWLSGQLRGGIPYPDACRVLESMFPPWTAADLFGPFEPGRRVPRDGGLQAPVTVLDSVPHGFLADALNGHWITCYQFSSGRDGTTHHHADIANVTADSERRIRAVNHPPEPRTEGRANPFRNRIEGELAGRHLIGHWKNTSDTRYFGSVHLAVLPGETVMDGYYTGVGSDIEVSVARWKWVRLGPAPLDSADLQGIVLREPSALYDLVMNRSQFDAPLTLADVREEPNDPD